MIRKINTDKITKLTTIFFFIKTVSTARDMQKILHMNNTAITKRFYKIQFVEKTHIVQLIKINL